MRKILFNVFARAVHRFPRFIASGNKLMDIEAPVKLANAMRETKIDFVLDVGANLGQFGMGLRENGYLGPIHSFEPIPDILGQLSRKVAHDTSWQCHGIAFGSSKGTLELNVTADPVFSSFLAPRHSDNAPFFEGNVIAKTISVPVMTLDSWAAENSEKLRGREIFLKIDTQGFDLEVIRGAGELLKTVRLIQFEGACDPIYMDMPLMWDILRVLSKLGFKIIDMFPVNRLGLCGQVVEYDCLMVRP